MTTAPAPDLAPAPPDGDGRSARWLARSGLVVAVLGWLWPIGAGGSMPVGGDATQFSIGLMATLRRSLRAGHWPLWNDLWGFGFPGLAESQMGLYYPAHWGYALLSAESAYAAILASHFLWGALGAAWAARRFGATETGAALAGFAWAGSGFFLIHLPHQWAYTVGSWMPWAWGLAWMTVRAERPARPALALAAVLAVQVLPGHFQLAFTTEVGVLLLAILGAGRGRGRGALAVVLALGAMIPLAAAQLVPTLALARLSGGSRGFEYLSGFAASPVHLVGHVAPGLFHRSPLWRPVAWDPFHTAPEEYLAYVGLVPLFLAARAVLARWRVDPAIRALASVGLIFTLLSLGPYVPGFRGLIALPGFSFFRAPARWALGSSLALAILAGRGFDLARAQGWSQRSVFGHAAAALIAVGGVVGGVELALASGRGPGWPVIAGAFDRALAAFPWAGTPGEPRFRAVVAEAYRPQADLRVQAAQARLDPKPFPPGGLVLARERWGVYAVELGGSAATLAAFLLVGLILARRPAALAWGLGLLTLADLAYHGRARPFDLGPVRPLVEQSPVLARVAQAPGGIRTLDPAQNLLQVVGANPATAYRTLTLPGPDAWIAAARGLDEGPGTAGALRALGVGGRLLDPFEARSAPAGWHAGAWGRPPEPIRDPALAGWLFGADFARLNRVEEFRWIESAGPPARAWLVDAPPVGDRIPPEVPAALRRAAPLAWRSAAPGLVEVDVEVRSDPARGPAWVVVSQTFDPEWSAAWVEESGTTRPATVERAYGAWQAVDASGLPPGRRTLRLEYEGRSARLGLLISAVAWPAWIGLGVRARRRARAAGAGLEGETKA